MDRAEEVTMAIYPTPEQVETLLSGPTDRPVMMVNLLRFKPRADAPDAGISGEDAYRRYADQHRAAGLDSQWLIAATTET